MKRLLIFCVVAGTAFGQANIRYDNYTHAVQKPPTSAGATKDYDFSALNIGGIAAVPGGSDGQFQYNNAGALAGTASLTISGGIISANASKFVIYDNASSSNNFKFNTSNLTGSRTVKLPDANSTTILPDTGAAHNFLIGIDLNGNITKAQPTGSDIGSGGTINGTTFADTNTYRAKDGINWRMGNAADATKQFQWDVSNLTTGATRTATMPDGNASLVIADTGAANNFLTAISSLGIISKARPTISNLTPLSGTSLLVGSNAGVASVNEITLGANLSMTGSTLNAAGGGDALTTNPLSQFSATTSSQFKGVISDENAPDGASSKVIMALGSISIASGKTITFDHTSTFTTTDGQIYTFPTTTATLARTDAANTFTGHQTIEGVTSTGATGTGKLVFDTSPTLVTPLLGTPTSGNFSTGTFTWPTFNQNTTGSAASNSISGQTGLLTFTGLASTNRAKTVRDAADTLIELGGSYTPTGVWTMTNAIGLPIGTGVSGLGTGVATALAVNTNSSGGFSPIDGTATFTNKTISSSTNTVGDGNTYSHDLTAVPNQTGGWTEYFVTGSDFTTTNTGASLIDITGLVTGTLVNSAWYEFEFNIGLLNGADANGMKIAIHGAGTGTAAAVFSTVVANTSAVASANTIAINAVDTATIAIVTYSSGEGQVTGKGRFRAASASIATMSLQLVKVTGNTATCRVGSVLRIKKAHT